MKALEHEGSALSRMAKVEITHLREKLETKNKEERTLRDWFAGQALAHIYYDPDLPEVAARAAYALADAMMEARK